MINTIHIMSKKIIKQYSHQTLMPKISLKPIHKAKEPSI